MREIPMKNGSVIIVDDEDYESLSQWSWYQDQKGYVSRSVRINGKKTTVKMQRVIMNPGEGLQVDHINGDKLDNRRVNLRVCTPFENMFNRTKNSVNKSGYKGVSWSKKMRTWRAYIGYRRIVEFIGYFDTPEEAYDAYCKRAKEVHGEFARF